MDVWASLTLNLVKRFPSRQAAEEWLNVMQRQHLQLFPHFLPQYLVHLLHRLHLPTL
jgi:hypothetical protein